MAPQGSGQGKGGGKGQGQGQGRGAGGGRGMGGGNRPGAGPGGECVCPNCGKKQTHVQGTPCYEMTCPDCNVSLVRE